MNKLKVYIKRMIIHENALRRLKYTVSVFDISANTEYLLSQMTQIHKLQHKSDYYTANRAANCATTALQWGGGGWTKG